VPRDPRGAARYYFEHGWLPLPVPYKSKEPNRADWPNLRPTAADLDDLFPANQDSNLGLLLGQPSDNLVDGDLDTIEAVRAAAVLMPRTPMVSGRKSKPRSHYFYRADHAPDKASEQFKDPIDRAMICELRSTGGQTVVPWSIHPSGETIGWHECGDPARESTDSLRRAIAYTAAAALLAKYWPDKGSRHGAALALAGGLLAAAWTPDFVRRFMSAVVAGAQDPEENDRLAAVDSTVAKMAAGEEVTGWPTLGENLTGDGAKVVKAVKKWLGISGRKGRKGGKDEEEKDSAATKLIKLAAEAGVVQFHSAEQVAYAVVPCNDHKETWGLKSTGFRRWLARLYYQSEEKAAIAEAIANAINTLEGKALFDGDERAVHVRLAGDLDRIYLDLGDVSWRVVEIDAQGWSILFESPVHFVRPRGLLPLPEPKAGGSLGELRPFVNVKQEDGWLLLLGFLFGAFHPTGPYPVLAEVGEQGSAKSTLGRLLRSTIDPNKAPLRRKPRDERDLAIAASNAWMVAFDNLSGLPDWLSDALCCISTGVGFSTRELYTDDEEKLFSYKRPVMLTSIEDIISRGDLLDRSLILELEPIPKHKRRTEAEVDGRFAKVHARILGALLTAVSGGLRNLPNTHLGQLPRMADFCLWAEACGRSVGWAPGAFVAAYKRNRAEVNDQALDVSPVTPVLREALAGQEDGTWKGTASELLEWLNGHAEEKVRKSKEWPASPKAMGNLIRRMAPNLRRSGISVTMGRVGKERQRIITLSLPPSAESGGNGPSAPSAGPETDEPDDSTPYQGQDNDIGDGGRSDRGDASADRPPVADSSAAPGEADESEGWRTVGGRIGDNEPSALNSGEGKGLETEPGRADEADEADAFLHLLSGALPDGTEYRVVRDAADLAPVLQALDESGRVGLDLETTGLNPRRDRPRLLQLATDSGVYVLDLFALGDCSPSATVRPRRPVRPPPADHLPVRPAQGAVATGAGGDHRPQGLFAGRCGPRARR
jgi:hypothetical protein